MMFVLSLYCNPSRVKDSIWPAQSEMTMPGQTFGLGDSGDVAISVHFWM